MVSPYGFSLRNRDRDGRDSTFYNFSFLRYLSLLWSILLTHCHIVVKKQGNKGVNGVWRWWDRCRDKGNFDCHRLRPLRSATFRYPAFHVRPDGQFLTGMDRGQLGGFSMGDLLGLRGRFFLKNLLTGPTPPPGKPWSPHGSGRVRRPHTLYRLCPQIADYWCT